jgi:hypothetical protein
LTGVTGGDRDVAHSDDAQYMLRVTRTSRANLGKSELGVIDDSIGNIAGRINGGIGLPIG